MKPPTNWLGEVFGGFTELPKPIGLSGKSRKIEKNYTLSLDGAKSTPFERCGTFKHKQSTLIHKLKEHFEISFEVALAYGGFHKLCQQTRGREDSPNAYAC